MQAFFSRHIDRCCEFHSGAAAPPPPPSRAAAQQAMKFAPASVFGQFYCLNPTRFVMYKQKLQNLTFTIDLGVPKFHVKQIFPHTGAQPEPPLYIKARTDGRISQTIFGIQSREVKRNIFSGVFGLQVDRYLGPPPGLAEQYCSAVRQYRLCKPHRVLHTKKSKFRWHGTGPCCKSAPSFQIRFAIRPHQSKALALNTCRKYGLAKRIYRFRKIQIWTPLA